MRNILRTACAVACLVGSTATLADCDNTDAAIAGAARFEISGGLAYDKTNNLTWQRCSVGQSLDGSGTCTGTTQKFTFEEAQALAKDGWRVPTLDEYGSIVAEYCRDPVIDLTVFPGTVSEHHWSSIFTNPMTWYFSFRNGNPNPTYYTSSRHAVRLVKTGR